MSVATISGVPCRFASGDTVIFTQSSSGYPSSLWNLDFVLSRDGQNLLTKRATANADESYTVTIAAGDGVKLTPGRAQWTDLFTEIATGQRIQDCSGWLMITPDPLKSLALTENQKSLAAVNLAIQRISASANASFSSNGTSFTRQNIGDLFKLRDRLQVLVNDELRALGLGQEGGARVIVNRFV